MLRVNRLITTCNCINERKCSKLAVHYNLPHTANEHLNKTQVFTKSRFTYNIKIIYLFPVTGRRYLRVVSMGDDINDILVEFRSLDPEPPEVRPKCEKCRLFS